MSESTTAAPRNTSLLIRGAEPADYDAIRGVMLGAYAQHAGQLAPEVFSRYLADQLDLGTHASYGRLLVAGQTRESAASRRSTRVHPLVRDKCLNAQS